ncbi:MAG: hypothetical protein LBT14_12405 [Treponema sp.]|jgi:hypothetical protein|nr:hypothetical protein [Treponema sp.]
MFMVSLQFTKQEGFTQRIGNLVVTGQYRTLQDFEFPANPYEFPLAGEVRVLFGGMEFRMSNEEEVFGIITADGTHIHVLPDYMIISGETVIFHIPGGTELAFATQYSGGAPELRISGSFTEDTRGVVLPFKPFRTTRTREGGNGQFVVIADGVHYGFSRPLTEEEQRFLILDSDAPVIAYRGIPEAKGVIPGNFVLAPAQDKRTYDEAIARWRDQSFSQWNRSIASVADEETVIAYAGEAIRQKIYKAAVSAVPTAFLNGNQRTVESTVYLGRLDLGLRSLATAEREKLNRLSGVLEGARDKGVPPSNAVENFLALVPEVHLFEYLAVRGYTPLMDAGAELVRSIEPAALSLDMTVGILEGCSDWVLYRSSVNNPFNALISETYSIIAKGITKARSGEWVFVIDHGEVDTAFNLRLGKAVIGHAEYTGDTEWAAVGRSLVWSVLSLTDGSGTVPAQLLVSETEAVGADPAAGRIGSAQLYRMFAPGENHPHAVSIGTGSSPTPIWTWTAASAVSATLENNMLDISVSFLVGEAHYMLIRGIKPFTRIQLYGINYRTDPQFERYDSSGWSYSASEQTLLLKMRHRSPAEHIRIFY